MNGTRDSAFDEAQPKNMQLGSSDTCLNHHDQVEDRSETYKQSSLELAIKLETEGKRHLERSRIHKFVSTLGPSIRSKITQIGLESAEKQYELIQHLMKKVQEETEHLRNDENSFPVPQITGPYACRTSASHENNLMASKDVQTLQPGDKILILVDNAKSWEYFRCFFTLFGEDSYSNAFRKVGFGTQPKFTPAVCVQLVGTISSVEKAIGSSTDECTILLTNKALLDKDQFIAKIWDALTNQWVFGEPHWRQVSEFSASFYDLHWNAVLRSCTNSLAENQQITMNGPDKTCSSKDSYDRLLDFQDSGHLTALCTATLKKKPEIIQSSNLEALNQAGHSSSSAQQFMPEHIRATPQEPQADFDEIETDQQVYGKFQYADMEEMEDDDEISNENRLEDSITQPCDDVGADFDIHRAEIFVQQSDKPQVDFQSSSYDQRSRLGLNQHFPKQSGDGCSMSPSQTITEDGDLEGATRSHEVTKPFADVVLTNFQDKGNKVARLGNQRRGANSEMLALGFGSLGIDLDDM